MRNHRLLLNLIMLACATALLASGCERRPTPTGATFSRTYPEWNYLLTHYTNDEGVDYAALAADRIPLDRAVAAMQAVTKAEFEQWPRPEQLAFLANAHNLFAIRRIVQEWPVVSLSQTRRLGDPLKARDIYVLGRWWSLLELRRRILSEEYLDSRALFLLNWGERGAPPLPPVAVTALNISDMLERQPRRFLTNPRYADYEWRERLITLSPLIRTYQAELERDYTTLWIFLERYLPGDLAQRARRQPPRIRFMDYDRELNVAPGVAAAGASETPAEPAAVPAAPGEAPFVGTLPAAPATSR